jgi:hypothetical protein
MTHNVEIDAAICGCVCGLPGCASRRAGQPQHGTENRYRKGCKCDLCLVHGTAPSRRRKARKNDESRERATRHGQRWTGPEMETALRDDLTIAEIARMLGRTRQAVSVMRAACRHDPKYVSAVGAATRVTPPGEDQP